jgi:hypothetical protein
MDRPVRADGGFAKVLLLHVAALSTAGAVAAAAALARRRLRGGDRRKQLPQAPAMAEMPRLRVAESGRLEYLEKFSHYVGQSVSHQPPPLFLVFSVALSCRCISEWFLSCPWRFSRCLIPVVRSVRG